MADSAPNYNDYLKLGPLLQLQGGLEENEDGLIPDELLFIVVHQALELWFKIVNRELRLARDHLGAETVAEEAIPHVVHHLRRINRVLELAFDHFKVMETLTPQDFLGFREKISPASGFQSSQMREMEILLGIKANQRVRYGKVDPIEHLKKLSKDSESNAGAWEKVQTVLEETTFQEALRTWLYRTPIHGSMPGDEGDEEVVLKFIKDYLTNFDGFMDRQCERLTANMPESGDTTGRFANSKKAATEFLMAEDAEEEHRPRLRRIRAGLLFIESYRTLPLLAWPRLLLDSVVELEQLILIWRNRHARMVERMIGRRVGTGGSSGVDYLDKTGKIRIFTDLWAVRTVMMPRDTLPPLHNPAFYGFAK
ncbi:MAG: tryptophan 2,3-dioxygenase [Deltaproteobacteria bacterium]|nr:tryptophan 2,3-dioxygenase [Deltaproteobacteria bacterium]